MTEERENTETDETKKARRSIWRQRGRRFTTGLNVCVSVFLAAVLLVMVNYLADRHYLHWNLSWRTYYSLSDKTRELLGSLEGDFDIIAFFRRSHPLFNDVRNLLKEYEYEASKIKQLNLRVEFVDPDRNLTRTKELKQKYDLTDVNVVVFGAGGRTKYIEAEDIADYGVRLADGRAFKKKVAFRGEQVFSSAIQTITETAIPAVYFVTGHGERDIKDYSRETGYSSLARIMRRDNMSVRRLLLAEKRGVPGDCSALVIAGPDRKFSRVEVDFLSSYLEKNGRIFLLVDPTLTTGLDGLLNDWGIKLGSGVVVGLTLTGWELVVTQYGEHPITRNFRNMTTMFYMPRPIKAVAASESTEDAQADKPRVSVLASNTGEGWLETDLNQNPPKYEPGIDAPGPIPVAVAVEKGPVSGIEVEIKPTRIVVVGDSYFVSNAALKGGVGGNVDFFMSAMNWLLEREALMAIAPKIPGELHLDMSRKQKQRTYLIIVGGLPAAVAFMGLAVWWRRRR